MVIIFLKEDWYFRLDLINLIFCLSLLSLDAVFLTCKNNYSPLKESETGFLKNPGIKLIWSGIVILKKLNGIFLLSIFIISSCTTTTKTATQAGKQVGPQIAAQELVYPDPTVGLGNLPSRDVFLDADWYRSTLIRTVDLWNGGLDGQSGMGVYRNDFNGYFNVNLHRNWKSYYLPAISAVAYSRCIYMNVEAYKTAGPVSGQRFMDAVLKGTDFLLEHFWDKEYGGFYWEVKENGDVNSDHKQGYGNVHPMFVLAQVYSITHDKKHLQAALDQLKILQEHFIEPGYPGSILPGLSRNFSQVIGFKGIDPFTHYFEALLSLHDVTEGKDREWVSRLLNDAGNLLVTRLYADMEGFDDRGYIAYNYSNDWMQSQIPYSRRDQWNGVMHATPGHGIEFVYLLSRAVERGYNAEWMKIAQKLLKFCMKYALNKETGGMLYDVLDYQGNPIPENPDNPFYMWWPNAETARALLNYTILRDLDYAHFFKKAESLIHEKLTDPEYGGFWNRIRESDLKPDIMEKGSVWKVNYHYTMFFAEALRLAETYPEKIAELNAQYLSFVGYCGP